MTDFKIVYKIDGDARGLKGEMRGVDKLWTNVGSGLSSIAGPAAAAAAGIATIGTVAVAVGRQVFDLSKMAAEFGSEIFDASKKTGLHAEALSAMKFAADQSGSSLDAITGGIAKFSKEVGAAADGSEKAAKKLEDFGINPKEAIEDLEGSLAKVFKRIQEAPEGIERMTLAQKAFGKSGADLLPFIDSFDGDLAGLTKRAKELGVTIDDEAAAAADAFGDQLDTLSAQLSGVGRTIGFEVMPIFMEWASETSEWAVRNKDEISAWAKGFASAIEFTASAITNNIEAFAAFGEILIGIANYDWVAVSSGVRRIGMAVRDQQQAWKDLNTPRDSGIRGGGGFMGRSSFIDPDDVSTGKKIRPPRETDSEFRKFFTERGFGVSRTFGGAVNAGSLHPSGLAADVSIKGKKIEEIFSLTAAALEKGYRLFDERVKRKGVKSTGPHLHFERGGSLKGSDFLGAEMYGGADQLAYLKSLDAKRMGKASGTGGLDDFLKDRNAALMKADEEFARHAQDVLDDWVRDLQTASEERLDIRRAEADQAITILETELQRGSMTEREFIERTGQLSIDMLKEEQTELQSQIPTRQTLHRLQQLGLIIQTQELKNTKELLSYDQKRLAAKASWNAMVREMAAASDKETAAMMRQSAEGSMVTAPGSLGGGIASGLGVELVPMFDSATSAMLTFQERMQLVSQDINTFVGQGIAQMVDGLGQMAAAWLSTGQLSAQAALQMLSSIAFSIATQAGIKAVFEYAEGLAALGTTWGVPNPASIAHFAAAKMYLTTAAIAGGAGVAFGLGARAAGGGGGKGGSSSGSSSGSASSSERDMTPISRQNQDTFISGRGTVFEQAAEHIAQVLGKLESKLETARPEDVFIAGMKRSPGAVGRQVVQDMGRNNGIATQMQRKSGVG